MPAAAAPARRFSWWTWLSIGLPCLVVIALLVIANWFRRVTAVVPEFYREALESTEKPVELKSPAAKFERSLRETSQDWAKADTWRLEIHATELNAWLARITPTKLAESLPPEWSQPRFRVQDKCILSAATFKGDVSGVVSLQIEPRITSVPRQLALRVRKIALGEFLIPESQWKQQLTFAAVNAGLELEWQIEEQDPLAILTLPRDLTEDIQREWQLTSLELEKDVLVITGTSQPVSQEQE